MCVCVCVCVCTIHKSTKHNTSTTQTERTNGQRTKRKIIHITGVCACVCMRKFISYTKPQHTPTPDTCQHHTKRTYETNLRNEQPTHRDRTNEQRTKIMTQRELCANRTNDKHKTVCKPNETKNQTERNNERPTQHLTTVCARVCVCKFSSLRVHKTTTSTPHTSTPDRKNERTTNETNSQHNTTQPELNNEQRTKQTTNTEVSRQVSKQVSVQVSK